MALINGYGLYLLNDWRTPEKLERCTHIKSGLKSRILINCSQSYLCFRLIKKVCIKQEIITLGDGFSPQRLRGYRDGRFEEDNVETDLR